MVKFIFKCETCSVSWTGTGNQDTASRRCRHCGNTIYGTVIPSGPPPAPPSAYSAPVAQKSAVQISPRRWENRNANQTNSPVILAPEPKLIVERALLSKSASKEELSMSAPLVMPERSIAISDRAESPPTPAPSSPPAKQTEEKKPQPLSPPAKEYIPIAERPENQGPKQKFFRFLALNSANGPGIAGAIAETRAEAIERIVMRFLENVAVLSNRNQKIHQFAMEHPLLLKANTPQSFVETLQRYGLTEDQYLLLLGPTPRDTLGGWNAHLQRNFAVGQASFMLAEHLKEELQNAAFIEYPLENCAFYVGGPMEFHSN